MNDITETVTDVATTVTEVAKTVRLPILPIALMVVGGVVVGGMIGYPIYRLGKATSRFLRAKKAATNTAASETTETTTDDMPAAAAGNVVDMPGTQRA